MGIPTYVRIDNSDALYQVDTVYTMNGEKRLNVFLESNREGIEQNNWLRVGYIPGGVNTSDGITKILSSVNLRSLLVGNTSRIVTGVWQKEIRRRIPSAKRYIVYPETIQGGFGH